VVIFPSGAILPTVPVALPVNQMVLPSAANHIPWGRGLIRPPSGQVGQASCTSMVLSIFPFTSSRTICPANSRVTQRRRAWSNSIPCGPLCAGIGWNVMAPDSVTCTT
jgi:hypothetical protein